ncbi:MULTISPECIES: hypothetical protein [unclassified Paenibacillus]|uniref:hypothetical protein n=1 Tax=unclassified Paenibacillus TaxID=185978 RepID=UPI000288ED8C|nr:hypothetical protein [Paenibacillus sp. S-12]EJW14963.1 hypothetical protein PAV_10c00810 [Paenibacillus alvei DSM 29]
MTLLDTTTQNQQPLARFISLETELQAGFIESRPRQMSGPIRRNRRLRHSTYHT